MLTLILHNKVLHVLQIVYNIFNGQFKNTKGAINMCMYCKCDALLPSFTTHVVNYKGNVIIIKNVPCEECEQCGEKYYTNNVAFHIEKLVSAAKQLMQDISVIDYSKIA